MMISRLLPVLAASLLGGAIAALPGNGWAQDATPVASPAAGEKTTAIVVSATHDPLRVSGRSEEHTSELQSLMRISYAVFCLKKKTTAQHHTTPSTNTND